MMVGSGQAASSKQSAPVNMGLQDAAKFLDRGYKALLRGDVKDASACCALVLKYHPNLKEPHFLVGLIAIEKSDWKMARHAFLNVTGLDAKHAAGWAQLARSHVMLGHYEGAEDALSNAISLNPQEPMVQDVIGNVKSLLGDQEGALHWFDKAKEGSKASVFDLSRAKALTFLGRVAEAREALESVLKGHPKAAMAHWMLARLEKIKDQTHIDQMSALVKGMDARHPDAPFYHYAIGKGWEDLGEWDKAFAAYDAGAKAKRLQIDYDEDWEKDLFQALEGRFDADWLKRQSGGNESPAPIFIIGQPRTGTTLVERIITAHSDVASAGELQQFAMAIKRATSISSPRPMTADIINALGDDHIGKIGDIYLNTTRAIRPNSPYFVDKMPVNYMYAPLIAAALPNAKIIHIVRGAADSCFSSYKQLFADAYFHSYDQEEMARHHVRYRRLMDKWRTVLGARMLDVVYEDVVDDVPENARKIIDFLGIEWQDACVDFHKQDGAVTTASATQVREKAHSRSVGRWTKFEEHLEPMLGVLGDAGLIRASKG